LGGPAIESHSVGGDENAGAVIAKAAVNKYFFLFAGEERQKLGDLLVGGGRPAADGIFTKRMRGIRFAAFLFDKFGIFTAKIHDDSDAEFFGCSMPSVCGCAREESVGNFSAVRKTSKFEFFRRRSDPEGWRGGRRRRLCAQGRTWSCQKNKEQSCQHAGHESFRTSSGYRENSRDAKVRNEARGLERERFIFSVKADYERSEGRRFRKVGRKIANVRFHGRMPKALEAKKYISSRARSADQRSKAMRYAATKTPVRVASQQWT